MFSFLQRCMTSCCAICYLTQLGSCLYTLSSGKNSLRPKKGKDFISYTVLTKKVTIIKLMILSGEHTRVKTWYILISPYSFRDLKRHNLPRTLLLLYAIYHRTISNLWCGTPFIYNFKPRLTSAVPCIILS